MPHNGTVNMCSEELGKFLDRRLGLTAKCRFAAFYRFPLLCNGMRFKFARRRSASDIRELHRVCGGRRVSAHSTYAHQRGHFKW